ncbi:MAG: sigma-70 family RNA polymerase sigma factor [Planctomycetes bacterium]|nr:sigma-70 family RNA polymerase sigma factor [Planctomycetota bacterium]
MSRVKRETWDAFVSDPSERTFYPLYLESSALIFTICRRILRDESDAADAFQSTYLRLLVLAGRTDETKVGADVAGMVCRLAVREADALRHRRMRRARKEVAVGTLVDSNPGPEEIASRRNIRAEIERAVETLPDRYRVPVLLHYFDGLTHDEVAVALGVSRSTVSNVIARALRKLEPKVRRAGLGEVIAVLVAIRGAAGLIDPPAGISAGQVYAKAAEMAAAGAAGVAAGAAAATGAAALLSAKTVVTAGASIAAVAAIGAAVYFFGAGGETLPGEPASTGARDTAALQEPAANGGGVAPLEGLPVDGGAAFAGTSIFGKVTIGETGLPAAGATVALIPSEQTATAGADGSFEIRDPEGHTVAVVAFQGPYVSHLRQSEVQPTPIVKDARNGPVDLVLRRGLEMTGRVIDADSGAPIEGAGITIRLLEERTVRTDHAGRFRFEGLPAMRLAVDARAPGFARVRALFEPVEDEENVCNYALVPEGVVAITVADIDGAPIEGAKVSYSLEESFLGWRVAPPTDAEGRAILHEMDPRTSPVLRAAKDGYELVEAVAPRFEGAEREASVTLVMRPAGAPGSGADPAPIEVAPGAGRRLEGTVVDPGGKPIGGVMIRPAILSGDISQRAVEIPGQPRAIDPARTTADGGFALEGLPDGAVVLDLWRDGYSDIRNLEATFDSAMTIVMKEAGVIRGRVIDAATGAILPAFTVKVSGGGVSVSRSGPGQRFASSEGRFVLSDLNQDRPFRVTIEAPGYPSLVRESVIARSPDDDAETTFALKAGSAVEGIVSDAASGRPIAGAGIAAIAVEQGIFDWDAIEQGSARYRGPALRTRTDEEGGFSVEEGERRVTLFVRSAGHGRRLVRPEDRDLLRDPGTGRLAIPLEPASAIEGIVRRGGEPLADIGLHASLQSGTSQTLGYFRTDPDGRFRLDELAGGTYRLSVYKQKGRTSFAWISRNVRIAPGEVAQVELGSDLGPHALSGRVLDGDGTPVAGARVSLRPEFEFAYGELCDYSDASGRFRIEGLAAGPYAALASVHAQVGGEFRERRAKATVEIRGDEVRDFSFHPERVVTARLSIPWKAHGLRPVRAFLDGGNAGSARVDGDRVSFAGRYRGMYALEVVFEAQGGLELTAKAAIPRRFEIDTTEGDVDLGAIEVPPPGRSSLSGQIRMSGGESAADLTIALEPLFDGAWTWFLTRSDAGGRFRVEGLEDGRYAVAVRGKSRSIGVQRETAREIEIRGETIEDFEIGRERAVSVRFEAGDDQASLLERLPGASLQALDWDHRHPRGPGGTYLFQGSRLESGSASFPGEFRGEYVLSVSLRGDDGATTFTIPRTFAIDTSEGDVDLGTIALPFASAGTLPIDLAIEAEGAAMPPFVTAYLYPGGDRRFPLVAGGIRARSGRTDLRMIPAGTYEVAIAAMGYRSVKARAAVPAGRDADPIAAVLRPQGAISGSVLPARGAWQRIALREVILEGEGIRRTLRPSDVTAPSGDLLYDRDRIASGSFQIVDLPAGTYEITIRADGFRPATQTVDVVPGTLAQPLVRLERE